MNTPPTATEVVTAARRRYDNDPDFHARVHIAVHIVDLVAPAGDKVTTAARRSALRLTAAVALHMTLAELPDAVSQR